MATPPFHLDTFLKSYVNVSQAYEVANRLDLIGPTVEQPEYNLFARQKVGECTACQSSMACASQASWVTACLQAVSAVSMRVIF